MKILHIVSTFSVDYPGGITNYIRVLAAEQIRDRHDVDVIDGGEYDDWTRHSLGLRVRSMPATGHHVHVASSRREPEEIRELLELLRAERYDIVHFHLTIGMGEELYESFDKIGVPYVVTLHDYFLFCPRITMMDWRGQSCGGPEARKCERCIGVLDQIDPLYRLSRKSGVPLPRLLSSSAVTRRNEKIHRFLLGARSVLAISNNVKDRFETQYPGVKCTLAHVGTPSAQTAPAPKNESKTLRLTFLGTLSRHKGADVLCELVERTTRTDIEFHFYGRALERAAQARLSATGAISHGPYREEDLPAIMAQTDLGLVLSIWEEGAGIVVMEFLNFCTPVLATRRGGLPDFVNEHNGFLFDPTPAGIDEALRFIDSLDHATLEHLRDGITPLTTPTEHWMQVSKAYDH